MTKTRVLSELGRRETAEVVRIIADDQRLRDGLHEQGFIEGADIEVMERGMFGGTPISVRVGRAIVALRRREADAVEVASR